MKSADEKTRDSAGTVAITIATFFMLSVITGMFGVRAAAWFGAGALTTAIIGLWEAGRNIAREEARQSPLSNQTGEG